MWNQFRTDAYEGIRAETIPLPSYDGVVINAYMAVPLAPGQYPGVVVIHHLPGWDEFYRETARRFASHGYNVIMPNLYYRIGHGTPDDLFAAVRARGGMPDAQVLGDLQAAMDWVRALPNSTGRLGLVGGCSGGRHAFLAACRLQGIAAAIDLWGGGVVMAPEQLSPERPVAPIEYTKDLSCPLLGIFGNDDPAPSVEQVNQHDEALKQAGKQYEFYRYDGAGHGFYSYDRPNYRQQQAMDAWEKMFAFFEKYLR